MKIVILASARNDSNTQKAVEAICPQLLGEYEVINLNNMNIEQYDYDGIYSSSDQFVEVAKKMNEAEAIVFATPVYWYAMSGLMKVFFDRLTDLLFTHKTIGKSLKGKETYLVSSGASPDLPEGFEQPFKLTSEYFDMHYRKAFYISSKS